MMWLRWTLPRLRIDQVMTVCLKYCIPLAAAMFLGAMLYTYAFPEGMLWRRPAIPSAPFSSPGVHAWGEGDGKMKHEPLQGACLAAETERDPGVNAWARERRSSVDTSDCLASGTQDRSREFAIAAQGGR